MTNEIFIKIISGIITVLIAIITGVVIPWIKSKIEREKIEVLNYYIKMAVRCAEQIYTPEEWVQKKHYVMDYITGIVNDNLNLTLTEDDISLLIEGAVNEIKRG